MTERFWRALARASHRHPFLVLAASVALTIPALLELPRLGLDTNLKRLLPENSSSVVLSRELEDSIGDGGYFSVLVESGDRAALVRSATEIADRVAGISGVRSVELKHPIDFIDRFRYTLVPDKLLRDFQGVIEDWKIEVNPFLLDLTDTEDSSERETDEEQDRLDRLLDHYAHIGEYQEDPDGRVMGMIIRTTEGISDLSSLRSLYGELSATASTVAHKNGVWWGVSGNLRSRVDEFDLIVSDLGRAGTVSGLAILLTLIVGFRSVRVLPVILYPLVVGLIWSFALVPILVGSLNTITAFLLLILFGMGVDHAVHLLARYRHELTCGPPEAALQETLRSTGRSVLTSGATTAVALSILALSDFRGFSDFGIIGGSSMAVIVLSMLLVMPATAAAGHKLGLVGPRPARAGRFRLPMPSPGATLVIAVVVLVSLVAVIGSLGFDYDFTNLRAKIPGKEAVRERHKKVFPATSAPAALYVASDLPALDAMIELLERARSESPNLGEITSVRNFAPDRQHFGRRLATLSEIRESLRGKWVRRLDDERKLEVIEDFLHFEPPAKGPELADIPASIRESLTAQDGSGAYVIGVDTNGRSRDGRMAMAFTADLYELTLPEGVRGPTGDKPVLAEILWLVTDESPRIVGLTFLGIFLLVWADRRSIRQTVWILVPLVAGLILTLGIMIAAGWKLNFFNMVVLPAVLGVGVDHGVHFYRRWRELEQNTRATQAELAGPISICALTTIMGYVGMVLAHHPGLRSIGNLAVVGLTATWATALLFLPGLLAWRQLRSR